MATYPVKYVNNAMRGAPVLNGTAGSLISVLDAFLVTGFGLTTAQSVTVAGGIATATVQAGNSFDKGCIVLVDGATPAALNGEQRVLTSSSTDITFATTAPDGAATGTITIKVAPAGWQKLYSGTNKAVYRSADPQASGFCLRVDDTGTTTARVRGFESMTDVDTGTGPFPTDAQISGGGYWWKSYAVGAKAVPYNIIADSRTLLLAMATGVPQTASASATPIRGFGDMLALAPGGDGFAVALSCGAGASFAHNFYLGAFNSASSGADAIYMARPPSGLGGSQPNSSLTYVGSNTSSAVSGADTTLGAFPSSVDGQLKYSRRYIHAGDGVTPRADVPGVLHVPQSSVLGLVQPRDILAGTGDMAGRTLLALAVNASNPSSVPTGIVLVDITGPWRA